MSPAGIQDASQSLLANCRSLIPVTQLTGVGRILVALCYQLAELIFGPDLAGLDIDLTTLNIDLNTITFIQLQFFAYGGWQNCSCTVTNFPNCSSQNDLECNNYVGTYYRWTSRFVSML